MIAPLPADEEQRLAALYAYELLDTPAEPLFDAFTQLAAQLCAAPIALISLVDRSRQFFKSARGFELTETARDGSFCALAILEEDVFEIPDVRSDGRFTDNPLVREDPGIRFYAGVALRSPEGFALGTLCVLDRRPRRLGDAQRAALTAIAAAVVEQFEARRATMRLFDSTQTELLHVDTATQRIVFASDAARRNLGYSLDELRELRLEAVLPSLGDGTRFGERIAEIRKMTGLRAAFQSTARRKDGSSYPVELRVELMTTRSRELAFVVASDLTQREAARQRIDLLLAAIEAAQEPIGILKPTEGSYENAIVVYANDAYLREKRAPAFEVIGQPADRYHGPKTDRAVLHRMLEELRGGKPARGEYLTYRADGSTYYTETSARPLLDAAGTMTHIVVVQRDVTETVLRGAQLAMQNERLTAITSIARTLFASLEPTVLVDALLSGVHELVGGEAALYAARSRGGFARTGDLLAHDDAPAADEFVLLAAGSEVIVLHESERRSAVRIGGSGNSVAYVLDVRRDEPFGSADVFALGLLAQYFAVAARNVELYQELAGRRDAVVELNQIKNDLIAMLAHDFKGPLTTIVGFADVLAEDDRFDEDARQYLGMISSSAMRLASLASDTLALSRLEQNELALHLGEVDLVPLVRDVVRVFSVTRPIDLRAGSDEMRIVGDAARLRQVVENLVGNAIKYSPGGEPVEVTLRTRDRTVELTVRDRGIGIPEGERAKLFGRFARASNARALGIGGTGFGLYLSKTIVEGHGGRVDVRSTEGHGSTFRVVLPQRAPAQGLAPRRIALLDDGGETQSYVAHALREDGYAVAVATGGEELLRLLADAPFDVALVDGDALGIPAASFLAGVPAGIPLVLLGYRAPADPAGWDAFLAKPFLMKDLYGALGAAAGQAKGGRSSPAVNAAGSA